MYGIGHQNENLGLINCNILPYLSSMRISQIDYLVRCLLDKGITDTETCIDLSIKVNSGLQIYGGPGSLSYDLKIWPITFQGSGPSGPILFSCEKISL